MKTTLSATCTRWLGLAGLVIACIALLPQRAAAQMHFPERELGDRIHAKQMTTGTFPMTNVLYVENEYRADMVSNTSGFNSKVKFKSNFTTVRAIISDSDRFLPDTGYLYKVIYELEGSTSLTNPAYNVSWIDSLMIGYDPDSLTAYQDQQERIYQKLYNARLTILGIYKVSDTTNPVLLTIQDVNNKNFYIELAMNYQFFLKTHYDPATEMAMYDSHVAIDSTSALRVSWTPQISPILETVTPVLYELEWTFSDSYKQDGTELSASEVPFQFKSNATRVSTDKSFYDIPVVYPQGYLIYRVRMVRVDSVQYRYPIYGPWSLTTESGKVGLHAGGNYHHVAVPHDSDKFNWNYSIQFAEGGKYKHVQSYYDGMLKNRQTITRFNSDPRRLLVTENIYDYEGRPSITTLPSVVADNYGFRYVDSVAVSPFTGKPYGAIDFDVKASGCPDSVVAPPLTTRSRANYYYSPLNTDTGGAQKFVPQAGGYPFVHTQLSPGFSDRVDKQGGAGNQLQINQGHDLANTYSGAEQPNLDALLGLNAGNEHYYNKTMSRDQNGQYSMTLKDFRGKPVATALVGAAVDTTTHAIVFNDEVPDTMKIRTDKLYGALQTTFGNQIVWNGHQELDEAALINVRYEYNFKPFQVCAAPHYQGLMVKGHYNYTVRDACGEIEMNRSGVLGETGVSYDSILAPVYDDASAAWKKGNHAIQKTLFIAQSDVYAAVDSFLAHPSYCVKTENEFIKESVDSRSFPCTGANSPCEELEKQLMEELFVGAKYGKDTTIGGAIAGKTPSIFDKVSVGSGDDKYRYRAPCVFDKLDSLKIKVYGTVYTHLGTMPVEQFRWVYMTTSDSFRYVIAKVLLPLHPEYCKLKNCFVDTFENRLLSIPDAATAEKYGFYSLDDLVEKDTLLRGKLSAGPFNIYDIADSLRTMWSGTIRIDTFAAEYAFCLTDDSAAYGDARRVFHDSIVAVSFPDTKTKNSYWEKQRVFYRQNRDRWKNIALTASGAGCAPCDTIWRMKLKPPPVAPQIYSVSGGFATGPGSALSMFGAGAQAALAYYGNSNQLIQDSASIQQFQDSANNAVQHIDSVLTYVAADSICGKLVNCFPNATARARMRDTLRAMFNRAEVHNGAFLPEQVRYAIVASGNSPGDLCHPYLFNYDYYGPGATPSGQCKSGAYYSEARIFFNDTAILNALSAATQSTATTTPHYNTATSFAGLIRAALGGTHPTSQLVYYQPAARCYRLTFRAGGTDSVTLSLRSSGVAAGSNGPLYGADALLFENVVCYFEDPQAYADGYAGQFMFRAKVRRTDTVFAAVAVTKTIFTGWDNGTVSMAETGANPLIACVPCTQMKEVFAEFRDSMTAYGGFYADHPLFGRSLRNFSNYQLKRLYGADQYARFIESCALADSVVIPAYGGWLRINFSGSNTFAGFQTSVQASTHPMYLDAILAHTATGGSMKAIVDPSNIPYHLLRYVRDTLTVAGTKQVGVPLTTGPGALWLPAGTDTAAVVAGSGFHLAGYTPGNADMGGLSPYYDRYELVAASGSSAAALSRGIASVRDNLYSNTIYGYLIPTALPTVNADYYKEEKQGYLAYTYSAQGKPAPKVLDTVQDFYIAANVTALAGQSVSYSGAANPAIHTGLYHAPSTNTYPGWSQLYHMMAGAKATLSGDRIFPDTGVNAMLATGALPDTMMIYRCGDGLYWYRHFEASTLKLRNVFIRVPVHVHKNLQPGLKLVGLQPGTGDSATRRFTALLTSASLPGDTLQAAGSTDFNLAWSNRLDDVLLGTDGIPIATNPQPASGEPGAALNCEQDKLRIAIDEGKVNYKNYITNLRDSLRAAFYAHVMGQTGEKLFVEYIDRRFAYTLYHYDLAGNLYMTVPPEGVHKLTGTSLAAVDAERRGGTASLVPVPPHTKRSTYEYNTANKPVMEKTPDGGQKDIYYDAKGNVILSQNAVQRPKGRFTYSLYDRQNRVIETGEVLWNNCAPFNDVPLYDSLLSQYTGKPDSCACKDLTHGVWTYCMPTSTTNFYNDSAFKAAIQSKPRSQVVVTIYDYPHTALETKAGMSAQLNLRARVAANLYFETLPPGPVYTGGYRHATHYSYDATGNVNTLTQEFPELGGVSQRYKRVDYEYDLHSGKVNMLAYNRGFSDQFYQRYAYDADNRITKVETSHDGYIWKGDAAYTYYQHGPLARVVLADGPVQGIDYAYTIQGWLKAINGAAIDSSLDMGGDGRIAGNGIYPKDAFATEINYFTGDYQAIGGTVFSGVPAQSKNLYNGNIARQSTDVANFGSLTADYTYDQMNRIRKAQYGTVNAGVLAFNDWYASAYRYDQDGNLQELTRYNRSDTMMDNFVYKYPNAGTDNRLADVLDFAADLPGYEDIKHNTTYNPAQPRMLYDATGNLVKDLTSATDSVRWNIYGKTTDMENRTQGWTMHLAYDGAGQRVSKRMTRGRVDTGRLENVTYYVRDATGNILAEYELEERWGGRGGRAVLNAIYDAIDPGDVGSSGYPDKIHWWLAEFANAGYLGDPLVASAIVGQGGVEINTDTIPAGYWLASDAALASSFLGSGQGVLSAMMNYSRQEGKYPIADALLLKMQSEDMSEVLGSLSTVLFRGPEETARQAAYLQLLTTSPAAWETITTGLGSTDTATLYALIDEALTNDDIYLRQVLLSVADAHPEEFYPWLAAATSDSVVLLSDWSGQWDYAGLLQRVLQDYGPAVAQTQADANGSLKHQEGFYAFASSWSDSYSLLGDADFGLLLYYNDPVKYITMYLDNGWPLDSVHEAVGKTPLFDFRSMARSMHVDPDAELPDIAYPAPAPLLYQTMRLASHHIYGSSRLGVNGYWSKQYDAVWDYREASRKTDTVRLLGRLPWFTNSLNSHIEAYAVQPWGNTQGLPSLAQHYLGQIQYELTNHLGNVQATVSDKKLAILDENSYRVAFHASLPAAYDYYPFGMLMKERTSMDTGEHPSYMSAVVSVPIVNGGLVALNGTNCGVAYGATLSYGSGVTMNGTNGELSVVVNGLTPGLPVTAKVVISYLADNAQLSAMDSAGTAMLASTAVTGNAEWTIVFTPVEGRAVLKVGLFPYLARPSKLLEVLRVSWEQQVGVDYRTQLVRVGTRTGDRYEFGFNGQQKVNEIAGVGNHNTALFWEYDTRLGKRWNRDPKPNPSLSNYSAFSNDPISKGDPLGDTIRIRGMHHRNPDPKTGLDEPWDYATWQIGKPNIRDGVYQEFAHGNLDKVMFDDKAGTAMDAQKFDAEMSKRSTTYKFDALMSDIYGSKMTIVMETCLSGAFDWTDKYTGKPGEPIAQKVSRAHRNAIVIAPDGDVVPYHKVDGTWGDMVLIRDGRDKHGYNLYRAGNWVHLKNGNVVQTDKSEIPKEFLDKNGKLNGKIMNEKPNAE